MTTVALVDPIWTGHHPTYLRFYSEALLEAGCRVMAFCSQPERLRSMLSTDGISLEDWQGVFYQSSPQPARKVSRVAARSAALERLAGLSETLARAEKTEKASIDLVFFSYLDAFIGHWLTGWDFGRMLGKQFSGLYFRPTHLRIKPRYGWLRRGSLNPLNPDAALLSSFCRSVAVLDEGIAQDLSKRLRGKPVICFPDLTDEQFSETPTALESEIREKAGRRKIVGLLGALDKRKGVLPFIQYAARFEDRPLFFLMAGALASHTFTEEENLSINWFMENPSHNSYVHNGFIENDIAFNGLVRCCDLLYAVYHRFPYSSGLLTKAACAQVPIVVSDRFLMAERVRRFNLGFVVREDSAEDVHALLSSPDTFDFRSTEAFKNGCRKYLEQHSLERLVDCFRQVLDA